MDLFQFTRNLARLSFNSNHLSAFHQQSPIYPFEQFPERIQD